MAGVPTLHFELPAERVAGRPPEARGLRRDQVRLLVARHGGVDHAVFDRVADHLRPGDLLVVNTSPTMPAAVPGAVGERPVVVHFSALHDDGTWTVELRRVDHTGPILDQEPGSEIDLGHGTLTLRERAVGGGTRLWRADLCIRGGIRRYLRKHGAPVRYAHVDGSWPLAAYQTVYADLAQWPGSAEMASAGRPFTSEVLGSVRAAGVDIATITLHAGVSSQESHEAPLAEFFAVGRRTTELVNRTVSSGGRVVAVGTTVTRALETVADRAGRIRHARGWTDLVLGPERPSRVVTGLVTGWHPPEASHLQLLEAVAGPELVANAYAEALAGDYLWHEFGDSCLLLPDRT